MNGSVVILLIAFGILYTGRVQAAEPVTRQGPEGIICLVDQHLTSAQLAADPGWTNPNVKGFLIREQWSYLEPTRGYFDFSLFKKADALAKQYHKFIGLAPCAGEYSPTWVYSEGAQPFVFTPANGGTLSEMPEPWDPVFLTCWSELITALAQHFDADKYVAYICMTGPGRDYEMGFVTDPADVANFDLMDGQNLWKQASIQIAGLFATAFQHTHLIYAMAPPTPDSEGAATDFSLMNGLFKTYPQFGVVCCSLAPATNPITPSVQFIQAKSSQYTVGFQMYEPASAMAQNQAGSTGASAEDILSDSFTKAVLYQAHYVEVYTGDCSTQGQQPNLKCADESLVKISKASSSP